MWYNNNNTAQNESEMTKWKPEHFYNKSKILCPGKSTVINWITLNILKQQLNKYIMQIILKVSWMFMTNFHPVQWKISSCWGLDLI